MKKTKIFLDNLTTILILILIMISSITISVIVNDLINCLVKYKIVEINSFGIFMFGIFKFYISLLSSLISFDFLIKLTEKYVYSKD